MSDFLKHGARRIKLTSNNSSLKTTPGTEVSRPTQNPSHKQTGSMSQLEVKRNSKDNFLLQKGDRTVKSNNFTLVIDDKNNNNNVTDATPYQ